MVSKCVIGSGVQLDIAYDAWCRARPEIQIRKIAINQNSRHEFDLTFLEEISSTANTAFAALDERFGNFKRMELMTILMERGLKLEPLISPNANLANNVHVGPNVMICDGVTVGYGSRIGYNSVLLPGVRVGVNVDIRPSCWLESGVIVGNAAKIGTHCTLRSGALLAPGIQVGRGCELGWAQHYGKDIRPKTVFDSRYDSPIYTYEY